ncbi:MAG: VCBS repeat-containing protein [Pseudohongiellaceae bacterium]
MYCLPTRIAVLKFLPLLSMGSIVWLTSVCFLSAANTVSAQLNFVATELPQEELDRPLVFEDLNGDGLLDLVEASWQPDLGRELLVYDQQADGRFATVPRRIDIKTEIIAVGFADLRDDPGKELVLFTNSELFSLSSLVEAYAGNLAAAGQWKLIADVPDPDRVQFIRNLKDIDGDGLTDLLLPGQKHYGYLRGQTDGTFILAQEFSTINLQLDPGLQPVGGGGFSTSMSINPEDGIRFSVSAQRPSPFADLVEVWRDENPDRRSLMNTEDWGDEDPNRSNLMNAENWMPSAQLADFNGDGRNDIVFLNVGLDIRGQLNLLMQGSDGSFPAQPDWQGSIDTRGDIRLADLDGDQLMDIVRLNGDGNQWDASLFRNRAGSFDFSSPDQVLRFSGYDVRVRFNDVTGDGIPELHVSYYTIPVLEAIRNTSILRTQLLFGRDRVTAGLLFNRRPDSSLEESFSAANVRALAEQMSLDFDLDADGRKDALYISDAGALAAKKIDERLRIADQPFWQYVPNRSVLIFWVQDLNQDGLPDLVLRHSSSLTVLVARP